MVRLSTGLWAITAAEAVVQSLSSSNSDTPASSTSSSPTNTPTFDVATSLGSIVTITSGSASIPTGSNTSFAATQSTIFAASNSSASSNSSATSTSSSALLLTAGGSRLTTSSTSTGPAPTNTQPCNNYPELCTREYMSFTEVCAHNSAFVRPNNAASNQAYPIISQLNDGIRMIQGETHYVNGSIYACHTSYDILNAGTLQDNLADVAGWVRTHAYDVVTILLVNSDFRNVSDYVAPIQNSGLAPYLYTPPKVPMHRGDWPTLGNMILTGKRVVVFMDYQADQTETPYILDQFSQMWETPYSPTDISFPCTQQRPPGLNSEQQDLVPYLANHNLNVQIDLGYSEILIPNFASLDQVNSVDGIGNNGSTGSLGAMASECNSTWGRPPAWLLVDFYEDGNYPGSVFEVAARMNGLDYTRAVSFCGKSTTVSAAAWSRRSSMLAAGFGVVTTAVVGSWGWL